MKILCLHGFGSSASIMKSQLAGFVKEADPGCEFVLVDGPFEACRGPGVSEDCPGPFYSHTSGYTPSLWTDALAEIGAVIEEQGPFDGAIGFSQGAAILLSYAYQHQFYEEIAPSSHAPFKFLICFSSTAPMVADPTCYDSILHGLSASAVRKKALTTQQQIFVDCTIQSFEAAKKIGVLGSRPDIDFFHASRERTYPSTSMGDELPWDMIPRVMHPALLSGRLRIPTVHITGKKDQPFMHDMSDLGKGVCDGAIMKVLEHSGGHSIPRKTAEIRKAVTAMDWAILQSQRSRL